MTADESIAIGWYHSACTVDLKTKLMCIRYILHTLHILCVMFGALIVYKLLARCYGGAIDNDLSDH